MDSWVESALHLVYRYTGVHTIVTCRLCVSMFRIKENKAVSVAIQETGLEVNAEKTGHMFMFCEKNGGESHSIKIGNESRGGVTELKYLQNN